MIAAKSSEKRPIKYVFIPIVAIVVVIVLIFAGFQFIGIKFESIEGNQVPIIYAGPDGTEIFAPVGSVVADASFSIEKLSEENLSDIPSWAENTVCGYGFVCDKEIIDDVNIKIPIITNNLCVIGHYDGNEWELVSFRTDNGYAISKVDSFSDFFIFEIDFSSLIYDLFLWKFDQLGNVPFKTTEELKIINDDAIDMITGEGEFIAENQVKLKIYNRAPLPMDVYPLLTRDVELEKTTIYGSDHEQGTVCRSGDWGMWITDLYPGESVSFEAYFGKGALTALIVELFPLPFKNTIIRAIETSFFAKNGEMLDMDDLVTVGTDGLVILSSGTVYAEFAKELKDILKLKDVADKIWSIYNIKADDILEIAKLTFKRYSEWNNIQDILTEIGSTFAQISFNTTESASSELWIEMPSGWKKVYDLSSNVYGTYNHFYEFGPLEQDTRYNYRIKAQGLGFKWRGAEEAWGSFKTSKHNDVIVEGGGTTDVRYTPTVKLSNYNYVTQYTATIEFATSDASRSELRYSIAFPTYELYTTAGLFSEYIFCVTEELGIARTEHKIELTYIVPNSKMLFIIYDCKNRFGYPWEEQAKDLIYFGSFETKFP